ncbi:dihydroorotase [Miltoncostaea marina]|uniref:dihydroorotase n=1 Tax=Miltoncostaea marina TaxID=2843215 RepID=UPI001C3C3F4A|nr:dihydroorotase [Miltoncostaea marina]
MAVRLVQRPGPAASLVIRGARVLDPLAGIDEVRDLVVRDGVIGGDPDGLEVVEAEGRLVVPGFVDPHVHLRTPGREDLEDIATGTRAAAAGGFVTIVAMPNTSPVVDTAAVLGALLERGEQEAAVRVGFLAAITVGQEGRELTEQAELAELGAVGFSDDGHPVADAEVMRRALQYQRITGLPLVLHEEDPSLSGRGVAHEGAVASRLGLQGIPSISESVAVARDAALAEYEGGWIHICHVSASETVEEIRRARARGVRVTGEASPHHLTLTDEAIASLDPARHKMNPPLREESDRLALVAALADGTIDCVATDHAPHDADEKEVPFEEAPFGITGLETAFAVCNTHLVETGALPLATLVRRMGADAAGVLGLPAPSLADGAVADVALIDPAARVVVGHEPFQSKSRNSAWLGEELRGRVELTIAGGRIAWRR